MLLNFSDEARQALAYAVDIAVYWKKPAIDGACLLVGAALTIATSDAGVSGAPQLESSCKQQFLSSQLARAVLMGELPERGQIPFDSASESLIRLTAPSLANARRSASINLTDILTALTEQQAHIIDEPDREIVLLSRTLLS